MNTRASGVGQRWAVAVLAAVIGALLLLRLLSAGCQSGRSDGLAQRFADRREKVELVNAMITAERRR